MRDVNDIPRAIRAQPASSDLLVVDQRVPLAPLIKALAAGGFTLINDRTGKLVITYWPEDYRAGADWIVFSSAVETRGAK